MGKVILLFILVSIIGASGSTLAKVALNDFPPSIIVFLRFFLAVLILSPFVLKEKIKIIPGTFRNLSFAGIALSFNLLFFVSGLQHTSIIMSQLMFIPTGLLVGLVGFLFLKEKITKNQIIGLILAILGMSILLYGSIKTQDVLSLGKPIGNILVGIGVLFWSFYLVLSRRLSKFYSPIAIAFSNFCFASIISLPLALWEFKKGDFLISEVTTSGILAILGLTFVSSIAFYLILQKLIKLTSAFIGSLTVYGVFLSVSILGPIFFQEKITLTFLIAAGLIIPGVLIATKSDKIQK